MGYSDHNKRLITLTVIILISFLFHGLLPGKYWIDSWLGHWGCVDHFDRRHLSDIDILHRRGLVPPHQIRSTDKVSVNKRSTRQDVKYNYICFKNIFIHSIKNKKQQKDFDFISLFKWSCILVFHAQLSSLLLLFCDVFFLHVVL